MSGQTNIWIKNPLAVFTANDQDARGGIVVRADKIIELVPQGQMPSTHYDEVYDASRSVLLPGLINTHHHLYQTLTRAFPPALNKRLFPWLQTLYPVWAKLRPNMLSLATELGLSELLLSRCQSIFHQASDSHRAHTARYWRNCTGLWGYRFKIHITH